jgi:hypothetical protein
VIELTYLAEDESSINVVSKISSIAGGEVKQVVRANDKMLKGPLIVHVTESNIKQVLDILEDRNESCIIAFSDKSNFKLLTFLKSNLDNVFGFIDLSLDYEYNVPLVKNYLNTQYSTKQIGIEKLANDLDKILEFTQTELGRVKELHDRMVKIRTENLKRSKIQIKFMAGEKSGGEFFDFIDHENEMIVIEFGSDSYITTSMIISEVETLKLKQNPKDELSQFIKKALEIASEYKSTLNYMITIFNTRSLEVEYFQKGNSKLFLNGELRSITGNGSIKLNRNSKVFFISEGAIKNWNLHHKESELNNFLVSHMNLENKDFINELFFELYRHKQGMFLTYDALMCVLEISNSVIHEV